MKQGKNLLMQSILIEKGKRLAEFEVYFKKSNGSGTGIIS